MPSLFGGGKTTTTTVVQMPGPTAMEQTLQQRALELTDFQLAQAREAAAEEAARRATPLARSQERLEALATENLLARLEGRAPVLSPEAQQRIGTVYETAKTRATEDLRRQLGEIAAMRGLLPTDTPAAAPFAREQANLLQGLEAARAQSELDVGQTETAFNQAVAEFQNRLTQQAFLNRMALATGNVAPAASVTLQNLFGQRLAAAPRSQIAGVTPSGLDILGGIGSIAGGLGGLATGLSGFSWLGGVGRR